MYPDNLVKSYDADFLFLYSSKHSAYALLSRIIIDITATKAFLIPITLRQYSNMILLPLLTSQNEVSYNLNSSAPMVHVLPTKYSILNIC